MNNNALSDIKRHSEAHMCCLSVIVALVASSVRRKKILGVIVCGAPITFDECFDVGW